MSHRSKKIAIVGGGVSGLSCASVLHQAGISLDIFEKSRGMGGRLAVRRVDGVGSFDIGAQFMTAESREFQAFLSRAKDGGAIAPWDVPMVHMTDDGNDPAHPRTRWVGVPSMNSWTGELFPREKILFEHLIHRVDRQGDFWILNEDRENIYDALIVAIPAPQAKNLLSPHIPINHRFYSFLKEEPMRPCHCLYVAFDKKIEVVFDAAFVRLRSSPLSWVARNSSKPGRDTLSEHWILHTQPEWSTEHFDEAPEKVQELLLSAFGDLIGQSLPAIRHQGSHRWRYASPLDPHPKECLWDSSLRLGLTGDWVRGGRVEGAFLSGLELANKALMLLS